MNVVCANCKDMVLLVNVEKFLSQCVPSSCWVIFLFETTIGSSRRAVSVRAMKSHSPFPAPSHDVRNVRDPAPPVTLQSFP